MRDIISDGDLRRSEVAATVGLHAAFGFPILDENQIFGVMTFFSREVQPPDVDLLQMMVSIGSQIAEFMKRKHAEEAKKESEERYRDLEAHHLEETNFLIDKIRQIVSETI